jgi:hypothetical protein
MDVNRPDIMAEVAAAFECYERALVSGDNDTVAGFFWADGRLVRFGLADEQRGITELLEWRQRQGALPGRRLLDTTIATFGPDAAVVTTGFAYADGPVRGRQSQTWIRTAQGWRIVAAHVSIMPAE